MAANSARTPASASRATGFQNPFAAGKVVSTGKGGPPPSTEAEGNGIGQLATDTAITALRLATCALMYHHGIDKIQNVDGFSVNVVAKYFGFLPGDPKLWTYLAAGTQVAGSGLLAAGIFSRPVALSMAGTMAAAVAFHLLNTGPEGFPLAVVKQHSYNYELAAMYVVVLGYFSAAGAGPFSVDQQVLGGEINFYKGLVGKVTGDDADEQ
jgi:uncharacterized membrane protein YphA (DoxX/SURF4 family)